MIEKANTGGNYDGWLQQVQQLTKGLIQQKVAESPEKAATAQQFDAEEISEDAVAQLQGKEEDLSGVENIVKNMLALQDEDGADTQNAQQAQGGAQEAQGAEEAGDKKGEGDDVKVEWQPLVKEGDVVEQGQPWGHFKITKQEKKQDAEKGSPDAAKQKVDGVTGASKKGAKAEQAAKPAAQPAAQQPGQDKQGAKASYKGAEGGKCYVVDQGTGEKVEIPENGEMKATRPMKIKSLGQSGELKQGDNLYTYDTPKPEELKKNKDGEQKDEGIKPTNQPTM